MPSDAVMRSVRHKLESSYHTGWRTRVGIGVFQQIVEDVLDAAEAVPRPYGIHADCVPVDDHAHEVTHLQGLLADKDDILETYEARIRSLEDDKRTLSNKIMEMNHP